ncbi:MAG: TatD family hydrolase [bacterium]|nr:TatD family hydrolase [bacterium]
MLIDSHNHLYFDSFDEDRAEVLQRMADSGVVGAVVIGIDPPSIFKAQQLALEHSQLVYSAGLHPTTPFGEICEVSGKFDAEAYFAPWFDANTRPVAIGECGIDLHWDVNPLEAQRVVFREQLLFARERSLPVIIHTRDANAETLEVLESVDGTCGVLHCFNGSTELLDFALSREGWYISFAGNLTYPKATELHEAARLVPWERLLVETDAPFLAPQAVRGKRCEPAHVVHTAKFLAELREVTCEELYAVLLQNARNCFDLSLPIG